MSNYKFFEEHNHKAVQSIKKNYSDIISELGEDVTRDGITKTPERASKAMQFLTQGYDQDPAAILKAAMFEEDYHDMVIIKSIELYSLCEHHMLPFFGKAHVAYIPKERVVGLSKLARVVEVFSKRLQTQERLTMQVAKTLMESLDAKGVAVTIDSTHQCMTMRGIKKEHASTVTNYYLGQFKEDLSFQNRYLRFISIAKD